MDGIGLVFAGGGGKGAYQLGVWKYLREYQLDRRICAVSGTSVGALNAALFAAGNYVQAEELWLNICPEQILTPRTCSSEDIIRWFKNLGIATVGGLLASGAPLLSGGLFVMGLLSMIPRSCSFSRQGLLSMMNQGLDFWDLQNAPIPCFATCLETPTFSLARFDLRQHDEDIIKQLLLASSAIPVIFDPVNVYGATYCDGGLPVVGDNVPIQPIYDMDIKTILVVHLSQDTVFDRDKFPGCRIIEIVPHVDLGGPIHGTLDFTATGAAWRMEQGYHDAQRVFQPLIDHLLVFHKNQQILHQASMQQKAFQQEYQQRNAVFQKHMQTMETDGISEIIKICTEENG